MLWRAMLKGLSRQTGERGSERFVEAQQVMMIAAAARSNRAVDRAREVTREILARGFGVDTGQRCSVLRFRTGISGALDQ
jgi:hypothetical protein